MKSWFLEAFTITAGIFALTIVVFNNIIGTFEYIQRTSGYLIPLIFVLVFCASYILTGIKRGKRFTGFSQLE